MTTQVPAIRPEAALACSGVAHFYTHVIMLLYPTVVLALESVFNRPYGELLGLLLPGYVLFGLVASLLSPSIGHRQRHAKGSAQLCACGVRLQGKGRQVGAERCIARANLNEASTHPKAIMITYDKTRGVMIALTMRGLCSATIHRMVMITDCNGRLIKFILTSLRE